MIPKIMETNPKICIKVTVSLNINVPITPLSIMIVERVIAVVMPIGYLDNMRADKILFEKVNINPIISKNINQ